jgi:hypothetical protein
LAETSVGATLSINAVVTTMSARDKATLLPKAVA